VPRLTKKLVDELRAKIVQLEKDNDYANQLNLEALEKNGSAMENGLKVGQLEKQIRIIGHIAADRKSEAIMEILTPLPISFGIDVKYANDGAREKAENEMLESLKRHLRDSVDHARAQGEVDAAKRCSAG
jgi:hypothetical protein